MTEWPVEIDGREYQPVPASWIDHGVDEDGGGTRVYAVSVGHSVRNLISIRYATREGVAACYVFEGVENPTGEGIVPAMLAQQHTDWPCSLVPHPDDQPAGVLRGPEIEHLRELWSDRIFGGVDVDERVAAGEVEA